MDHPANSQHELPQTGASNPMLPRSGGVTLNRLLFGLLKLFLLVAALAGALFAAKGIRLTYNGRLSASWPSASGTIVESRVAASEPRQLFGRESEPMYGAEISYEFRVAGRSYIGNTVSFSMGSVDQSAAENRVRKYPIGKAVAVYYNPEDPTKSVLEPGIEENAYILLFSGFMFLASTLVLGWAVARLKKEISSG